MLNHGLFLFLWLITFLNFFNQDLVNMSFPLALLYKDWVNSFMIEMVIFFFLFSCFNKYMYFTSSIFSSNLYLPFLLFPLTSFLRSIPIYLVQHKCLHKINFGGLNLFFKAELVTCLICIKWNDMAILCRFVRHSTSQCIQVLI